MTTSASRTSRTGRLVMACLVATGLLLSVWPSAAAAHPLSTTAVLLDLHPDRVVGTLQLPLDRLSVALDHDLTAERSLSDDTLPGLRDYVGGHLSAVDPAGAPWSTSVSGGRVQDVDGVEHLVLDAVLIPPSGSVTDFVLRYDAIVERLVSHRVLVASRTAGDGAHTELAMLSWQQQEVLVSASDVPVRGGVTATVALGLGHIAEGSDHLLFLVLLLLPAPLVARGGRWVRRDDVGQAVRRVVHVSGAFAIGHSVTLALGAAGLVALPVRIVEAGIAVSVLVSAAHAAKPLVRRGEVLIGGSFGLLHGLAFATLLDELDLARADLVQNLLGFNVGIELAQLAVVALVMPSLLVLSRTRAYPAIRSGIAGTGALLASAWLLERVGVMARNPLDPVADLLVEHPFPLAGALAGVALAAVCVPALRAGVRSTTV